MSVQGEYKFELSEEQEGVTLGAADQIARWYFATPEEYRSMVLEDRAYLSSIALADCGLDRSQLSPHQYFVALGSTETQAVGKIAITLRIEEGK